jgi:hypothetical protein
MNGERDRKPPKHYAPKHYETPPGGSSIMKPV